MEEILLKIGSKESYEAIKLFADKLDDVEILEKTSDNNFPFSKEESDRRIEMSLQQFSEGRTISLDESKKKTAEIFSKDKTWMPGEPFTKEEIEERLQKSREQVAAGNYFSLDEVKASINRRIQNARSSSQV
jgi:hypothetical protein